MMRRTACALVFCVVLTAVAAPAAPAGVPCSATSSVWADDYTASRGDSVAVHAIVRDCGGSPIAGAAVFFLTDRGGADVVASNAEVTDHSGQASAPLRALITGNSHLYAECYSDTAGPVLIGPAASAVHWVYEPRPLVVTLDSCIAVAYDYDAQMYDLDAHLLAAVPTCRPAAVYPVTGTGGEARMVIADSCAVSIYDLEGHPVAAGILTNGWATPTVVDSRIIIVDDSGVYIYDLDGNLKGFHPVAGPRPSIYTVDSRIIIVGASGVYIYDLDGNLKGFHPIAGGRASIYTVDSRIIIVENGIVWIYDLDGNLIGSATTTGRASIYVVDSRIVIVDGTCVYIYDLNGNLLRIHPVTGGRASIYTIDSRIIIVEDGIVWIYDLDGNLIGSATTTGRASIYTVDSRIIIVEDGIVWIYDLDGNLIGSATTTGRADIFFIDSRIVIVDDSGVYIYDLNGNLLRIHGVTGSRASIYFVDSRIIIVEDNVVWIYDLDGNLIGSASTTGRASIYTVDSRIIIVENGIVWIYDLDGNLRGSVTTAGRASIKTIDSRIIIVDGTAVSIYDLDGNLVSYFASVADDLDPIAPGATMLLANRPNPFAVGTEIRYVLAEPCLVRLTLYNVLGEEVARLVDERQPAGLHVVRWDASNVGDRPATSGVYFCRLRAGDSVDIRRMLMVR